MRPFIFFKFTEITKNLQTDEICKRLVLFPSQSNGDFLYFAHLNEKTNFSVQEMPLQCCVISPQLTCLEFQFFPKKFFFYQCAPTEFKKLDDL